MERKKERKKKCERIDNERRRLLNRQVNVYFVRRGHIIFIHILFHAHHLPPTRNRYSRVIQDVLYGTMASASVAVLRLAHFSTEPLAFDHHHHRSFCNCMPF